MEAGSNRRGTFPKSAPETFEKVTGRPREDRFARSFEIFTAVLPLLEEHGARALTMRAAAEAACMSVSALYHYFPTKRDMLLFPLQPEPCAEQLERFEREHALLRISDPPAYVRAFIDEMVETFPLIRASLAAAVEMSAREFWKAMDEAIGIELEDRIATLSSIGVQHENLAQLARSLRRAFMGATLDRNITPSELRQDLLRIMKGTERASGLGATG